MNAQCNYTSLSDTELILPRFAPSTFNIYVSDHPIFFLFGQNISTKDIVLSPGDYDQEICIRKIDTLNITNCEI